MVSKQLQYSYKASRYASSYWQINFFILFLLFYCDRHQDCGGFSFYRNEFCVSTISAFNPLKSVARMSPAATGAGNSIPLSTLSEFGS